MQWEEGKRGFQHRVSRGAAEDTEKRNPRAQPAMAVPQGAWGGIRWRKRDERDERIDTGGE
jgi:hypothetical protein